jgi:Flp pilus assembly protein TadD
MPGSPLVPKPLALGALLLLVTPLAAVEPETPSTLLARAEAALAAGDLETAEAAYREVMARSVTSTDAVSGLARVFVRRGEEARAVEILVAGSRRSLAAGRYDAAVGLSRSATELRPGSGELHALHGRALALAERFQEAEVELARAVELGAAEMPILLYLASARWENGDLEAAAEGFREAVERDPGSWVALHQLGRLELWRGRYPEAIELLGRVARRHPGSVDVQLDYARALDGAGRAEPAAEAYRRVLALSPAHSNARYGLARQLLATGAEEEARRQLELYRSGYEDEQRMTREVGLANALVDRAGNLVAQDQTDAALEVLAGLPESPEVLAAQADAYLAAGDRERAIVSLERAVALAPDRKDLQTRLQEIRLSAGWP